MSPDQQDRFTDLTAEERFQDRDTKTQKDAAEVRFLKARAATEEARAAALEQLHKFRRLYTPMFFASPWHGSSSWLLSYCFRDSNITASIWKNRF